MKSLHFTIGCPASFPFTSRRPAFDSLLVHEVREYRPSNQPLVWHLLHLRRNDELMETQRLGLFSAHCDRGIDAYRARRGNQTGEQCHKSHGAANRCERHGVM